MSTRLVDDRHKGLEIGYQATDWSSPVEYAVYKDKLQDWIVKAIVRDDKCIGAFYLKDGEVHVSILPEWRKRWATRGILKEILSHKSVHTRVTPGHEYMHNVLRRLGFEHADDGRFVKRY